MIKSRHNKGITLIALVITIVVLLVLAGVILNSMQESGIIGKAKTAKTETNIAAEKEQLRLAVMSAYDEKTKAISKQTLESELGTGWQVAGEEGGPYTCTSPKGNKFTVDANGTITENSSNGNIIESSVIAATIECENTVNETDTLTAKITHNVSNGNVDISKCKYEITNNADEIGEDESKYSNTFNSNGETITIDINSINDNDDSTEEKSCYIHVLTVDENNNKKETISNEIVIHKWYYGKIFLNGENVTNTCYSPEKNIYILEKDGYKLRIIMSDDTTKQITLRLPSCTDSDFEGPEQYIFKGVKAPNCKVLTNGMSEIICEINSGYEGNINIQCIIVK